MAGAFAVLATGCAADHATTGKLPAPIWPRYRQTRKTLINPPPKRPANSPYRYSARPNTDPIHIIARATWTSAKPNRSEIKPMNGIDRITVHHAGLDPVYFTDARTTARHLEQIRLVHTRDRNWADIGYHLVIDRAGRVWEARPIRYQGAHVSEENEHNLGIVCLGNFDQQEPTQAQRTALRRTLIAYRRKYHIPADRIFTHQEIHPTKCPGAALQRYVVRLRRDRNALALETDPPANDLQRPTAALASTQARP